jgi:hypothetical protein
MTSYLRKSVVMGKYDPLSPNQNFGYFAGDWQATNTPYVRFWIPWPRLAPYGWNNPANDTTYYAGTNVRVMDWVAGMDAQIKYARQLGLQIILTFDQFPQWVTGDSNNRVPPSDVSLYSAWGQYMAWVYTRWSAINPSVAGSYTDYVEICNEPNNYPAYPGYPAPVYAPGRMMLTAQQIQSAYGYSTPILAGPALEDNSSVSTFASDLLGYLGTNGFTAITGFGGNTRWAWTHHNYGDVEKEGGATTRAQWVRNHLVGAGWKGWPYADPTNPYLLITEGGARIGPNFTESSAATRTQTAYNNVHNDSPSGGMGLAMFSNYLDVTDTQPSGDCGLRRADAPNYTLRPLYSTWAALPQP